MPDRSLRCPTPLSRRLLTALVAAVALFWGIQVWHIARQDPTFGTWLQAQDMYAYDMWAQAMASGDWSYNPRPSIPLDPTYAIIVAGIYKVFGARMFAVAVVQAFVGLGVVAAAATMTSRLFGRRSAIVAGTIVGLYGPLVFYETRLLRAVWVTAALALGAWAMVAALQEKRMGLWAAAGLGFGLATGLRPNNLLVGLVAAVVCYVSPPLPVRQGGARLPRLHVPSRLPWRRGSPFERCIRRRAERPVRRW